MSHLATLMRTLTTGVHVVGVASGTRRDGFTAAWVMQVSFDPLLLALSINPDHASYPLLLAGGGFVINVLGSEQLDLARHFGTRSGRDGDKLEGVAWRPGRHGAPILETAVACLECDLAGAMRAGDHELVLGQVMSGGVLRSGAVLTYAQTGDMDGSAALFPSALPVVSSAAPSRPDPSSEK